MNTRIIRLTSLLFAALFSLNISSQEEINPKETFVEAESYFLFEEYTDALPLYQKLLRLEPENYNLMYKIGICYLNSPYQKEKSIRYLLDASKHISKEYKTNSYKEKMAPPEVNYYLGQSYRVNEQFDKALEYYSLFKKDLDPLVFDVEVVNDEIASCQVAKKMLPSPIYLSHSNAGSDVNSRFADFNAVLSGDGKTLIFTRALQFYDGVFITTKDDKGNWSPPYNLTPDFGLDGNSYTTGISYYGDEIYVYRSDNFDGNLYSSKLVNGKWQVLKKLNENINTKYWESHASPSPDGKYLFFTSNRKGGYGGLDIYKAPRIAGGDWGAPVNLGPIVNSKYNEDAPVMSPDNHKLFFSSLGHNGMGGYDIFVSEMNGPSSWERPVNMGYPLNTPDDDLFFCPIESEDASGIYSFYNESSTNGLLDIYWVKVYNSVLPRTFTITGKVNVPTQNLLDNENIKISIIDNKQGKIIEQVSTNEAGEFTIKTNQGNYQILVDGKGIKPVTLPLNLALTQESSDIDLPLISTQIAAAGEDILIAAPSELPKLEVVGEKSIITEKSPVEIKLSVQAGNKLEIENYVNGKLDRKEELIVSKDKYSYVFSPKPGDNRLVFTIHDKKGNVNQQEVTVYYKTAEEEVPISLEQVQPRTTELSEIASLASGNLQKYLNSLESLEYNSLSELYELLNSKAAENGYAQEEINKLIALLLTQRNKEEFITETRKFEQLELIYTNDTLIASTGLPIIIVQDSKIIHPDESKLFDKNLINVVPFSGEPDKLFDYILSFTEIVPGSVKPQDLSNIYNSLINVANEKQVSEGIELSSTTANIDQFYFILVSGADAELKQILLSLNFDSLKIFNSIDLVEHLFNLAEQGKLDINSLIDYIEKAQGFEKQNLLLFKESLANAASGGLKAHIQELDITNPSTNEYIEIIETLLRDAKAKGYNMSEVYDLLINMIGIDNVDEFVSAMRKYATGDLNTLLTNIDKSRFSKPIELIQYLLSETSDFDFSDSDINKLLLRMLLEKGITGHEVGKEATYSHELIRKRRFITSIVLANILLIILLILFWRRKRKKEEK